MALRKKKTDEGVDLTIQDEEDSDSSMEGLEAKIQQEIEEAKSSENSTGPEKKMKRPKRKAIRSETESDDSADDELTEASVGEISSEEDTVEDTPDEPEEEKIDEDELPRGFRKLRKKHYRESSHEELYEEGAPELTGGVRKLRRRHYAETKEDLNKAGVRTYGDVLNGKWQGSWLQANWRPVVILLFIFFFALFVRSYYGAGPATENGFILSGGSDSYYHDWVINNTLNTGDHYFYDNMINYPVGTRNPRPPLYDWSVNLGGIALTPFFGGDVVKSTWYVFLYSTAFWGAITVIPTYLLATEAFGRKAGYISAFLLAVMPGHIQRSVLSNADHDAMALFFIVFCFYFFFRALKSLSDKSWVDSWRKPREIKDGLFAMLNNNMDAVIYALMAGLSLAAVALIWKGYAYVLVILTAYFLIQVLLDRFRNSDSTEVLLVYMVTVGTALLLIFPYYWLSIQIPGWFDTPTFMFLGASALGAVFIVTRKLPWLLVLVSLILLGIIAMVVMAIVAPDTLSSIMDTVGSGAGYFIRNKQYETIAEAQAPPFSNLALSFGVFTFWLSFIGVAWAIYQLPKRMKFDYIFVVIWTAASIFMATNAARFMFNAAPVFAITSGWIVALIIDKLDFKDFVQHQKRMVSMRLTRGFALAMVGATAGVIALAILLSIYTDIAAPIFVVGITALISALMMNLIAEVNPKRSFHLLAIVIPLGTAGFYLMGIFAKGWDMEMSTHGFIFVVVLILNFLLYLTVKKTRISFTVGVLFLAFFVIYPNVMSGMDAGIPYEVKTDHDLEFYDVMPVFLKPDGYDEVNGTNWYLGGFGYSLPLNTKYYPAGYDWLATQDQNIYPPEDRPAYLSWWDYGFEAVNEGRHPTVADNFLGGHQLAGNFIMAQSEEQAVALLIVRLLEADWKGKDISVIRGEFSDQIKNIMEKYALDVDKMQDIYENPARYKQTIWDNPDIYGPRDDVLQDANARYLAARGEITENLDLDQIVALYHDVREETGFSIRYFAIDSRIFPFSADNTGIFYAPAKLSDHRIDDVGNQPYDFFEIKAVGEYGGVYDIDDIPDDVSLDPDNPYKIVYHDMFYNSMMYKCFVGYSAEDMGQSNDDGGIPAISESMKDSPIMPGWNQSHFKLVHRTAYWNPYDAKEIQNHTDAWRAMNFWDAVDKQEAGDGISDLSDRSSLYQGVMMLKYYDGAILTGRVQLDDGAPLEGAAVTVLDDFGIPHDVTYTDADGNYELVVPFGDIKIITSQGPLTPQSLTGEVLNETEMHIEDYQSMREEVDLDGNGIWDYMITNDVTIEGGDVSGKVFWDMNENTQFDLGDVAIQDAEVTLSSVNFPDENVRYTDTTGNVLFQSMPPGTAVVTIQFSNRTMLQVNVTLTSNQVDEEEWGIKPTTLNGRVYLDNGTLTNASVNIWIEGETAQTTMSDENGNYTFDNLLYGEYKLQAVGDEVASPVETIIINNLQNNSKDLSMSQRYSISGTIQMPDGTPAIGAKLRIISLDNSSKNTIVRADMDGNYHFYIPRGKYMASVGYPVNGVEYVYTASGFFDKDVKSQTLELEKGCLVEGYLSVEGERLKASNIAVSFTTDASQYTTFTYTDTSGHYSVYLPANTYIVNSDASSVDGTVAYYDKVEITGDSTLNIDLTEAVETNWQIYYDRNGNEIIDDGESLENVKIRFTDPVGKETYMFTDIDGMASTKLPASVVYDVLINYPGFQPLVIADLTTDELASREFVRDMTPSMVKIEGNILMDGEILTGENAYVEFTGDNSTGARSTRVQMGPDGTYEINLWPGEYSVGLRKNKTQGNDSVIIEIEEPLDLIVGLNDGSTPTLDINVKERVKFTSNLTRDGAGSSGNLTFVGPENRMMNQESGSEVFYIEAGEYLVRASFATGEDIFVGTVRVNITENATVTIELIKADLVTGNVRYETDMMGSRTIEFYDTVTGDTIVRTTDENGGYSVELVPKRKYNVTVDFVAFDENDGIAYRYYNEKEGDKDVISTLGAGRQSLNLILLRDNFIIDLNGTVLTENGANASGVELKFMSGKDTLTANTDAFGRYSVALPPGTYLVLVQDPVSHDSHLENITVGIDAETDEMNFTISPSYKMSGSVYYNQNKNLETTLYFSNEKGTLNVTTGADGYYNIWLPPDDYNVSATAYIVENGIDVSYELLAPIELNSNLRKNLPLTKVQEFGVEAELTSLTTGEIAPGGSAEYLLTVTNTGNIPDTYDLTYTADPGWKVIFNKTRLDLEYGSVGLTETVSVTVNSPDDARVSHTDISLKVTSIKSPVTKTSSTADFVVKQTYSVEIENETTTPSFDNDQLSFTATVVNTGNGPDLYTVYIANSEELAAQGWDVSITGTSATDSDISEDGKTVYNMSAANDIRTNIDIVLDQNSDTPYSSVKVLLAAKSQNNEDVFTSQYMVVKYPKLLLGDSNVTVTSDLIDPSPNTDPALGIMVMMISVGFSLLMFYVMKKKRWLR